jgi:hypothetical protein
VRNKRLLTGIIAAFFAQIAKIRTFVELIITH